MTQSDAPKVSIAASPSTIVEGGTVRLTFTASEAPGADLDVIYRNIGGSRFGLTAGTDQQRTATIASGRTTATVELATRPDEFATGAGTVLTFQIEPSVSPAGAAYQLGDTAQARVTVTQDTTAPALHTATVNGAALVLTYDEALDTGSVPGPSAFTVTVAGATRALAGTNPVAVSGRTVTLTLARAVVHGSRR